MADAVSLRALTHRYGDHPALAEVSMTVEPGTLHALLGPNGSGKTTLFRILTTLLRPTSGDALVFGDDVTQQPDAVRRRIGVVFQHPALDEQLTVREQLDVQAALYGLERADARRRSDALLEALALSPLAGRLIRTLSGGERRRADLARALLHQPDLLLLDEPTTALDPAARRQFHDLLGGFRARDGVTILMATHLLDEADTADAVTILHRGRVVQYGSPDVLKAALGRETLWITPKPGSMLDRTDAFDIGDAHIQRVGPRLRVEHARPTEVLAQIATTYPAAIADATLRHPTLDDVFFAATGSDFGESNASSHSPLHP